MYTRQGGAYRSRPGADDDGGDDSSSSSSRSSSSDDDHNNHSDGTGGTPARPSGPRSPRRTTGAAAAAAAAAATAVGVEDRPATPPPLPGGLEVDRHPPAGAVDGTGRAAPGGAARRMSIEVGAGHDHRPRSIETEDDETDEAENDADSPQRSRRSLLEGLSEALMRRSLTKIDLSQRGLRPLDARLIKMALAQNVQIMVLKLGYNALGDEGVHVLCPAIAEHAALESLDIGFNQVGDVGCKDLMDAIASNNERFENEESQRAWTLYLAGNMIGEDGALSVADLISQPTRPRRCCVVRRLYMTGNRLGPAGVRAIAKALSHDEALRRQQFQPSDVNTDMESSESYHIADSSVVLGGLEELALGGTQMGVTGCDAVSQLAAESHCLKALSLPNCDITDDMLCTLATCIKSNRAHLPLQSLQLSFNYITSKGMEALTNAVWGSETLKELLVDNNKIGDVGAQLVATIVPGITAPLETLNVGFDSIKSSGMRVLMKAVAESQSLRTLSVAGNAVDATSAKFVAYALAHNESLWSISLDHCSISQEGKRQIVAGIVSNSRTKLQEFRGFNIGPIVVTLGFPAVMEHWNNDHVVNFIHLMWQRSSVDAVKPDITDPLHFLGFPDGSVSDKKGPLDAGVVVDVAKKAFTSLVEEGVDVFSRRAGQVSGYMDASPFDDGGNPSNGTPLFGYRSMVLNCEESESGSFPQHPVKSFVAPPEERKVEASTDPKRKKRIVEWLCVNIQHLNKLAQKPFSSSELWKLHQHYFTPVVNESGGNVMPSPSPSMGDPVGIVGMSSVPEVSTTSTNSPCEMGSEAAVDSIAGPKSDPQMKGSPFAGLSPIPLLKRKVSYRFLGDAALATSPQLDVTNFNELRSSLSAPPAQNSSVAMMIESGPVGHTMPNKTKRARRNRSRISFLPKVKAKLDSYLDVCHEKALVTMRQLYFVEQAILSGQVNPIDPATTVRTHLCGAFAFDAETIVCDMI